MTAMRAGLLARLGVMVALAGCESAPEVADAAAHADLAARLAKADARATELDDERRRGITALVVEATPAAPKTCPDGIKLDRSTRVDNFVTMPVDAKIVFPKTAKAKPLPEAIGLRRFYFDAKTEWDRKAIDGKSVAKDQVAAFAARIDGYAATTFWHPYEIAFVVTRVDTPHVGPNKTFTGGALSGRVVVWSYEKSAVACWAPVETNLAETEEVRREAPTDQDESLLYYAYTYGEGQAIKAVGLSGLAGDLLIRPNPSY